MSEKKIVKIEIIKIEIMPKILGEMMFQIQGIKELELADQFLMDAQSQIIRYLERKEEEK